MAVIIARDLVREPLYAIVPLFNPFRWRSRFKHTERAIKHFIDSGATVILVETCFNRREAVFADSGIDGLSSTCSGILGADNRFKHRYIQLRTKDELWLKENSINVAVGMALPYDWQQLCWLDSDVHFLRPNWVGECVQKLQHYKFLQMFSHARDMGPNYELLPENYPHADGVGFVKASQGGKVFTSGYNGKPAALRTWPGLAWAATRQAWDETGGLLDFAVWGGGDWHMAHCLIEQKEMLMRTDLHGNYQAMVMAYFEKCQRYIRRNVGVMEGSIFHAWHGRKEERGYNSKHALLAKIGFDPIRHLKRDFQGLYQLNDDGSEAYIQLRDTMRQIATDRNEDSIDVNIPNGGQGH